MRRALFLAALAALVLPAGAWAHATLRSTTPRFGHELQRTPHAIRLHFDQLVRILPGAIEVLNDRGRNFAGPAHIEGTDVVASVPPLSRGAYTVRWRAISADSHVVSGVWTFGVQVPAPSVNDAYGAGGPTVQEHVVRWIWFLSLAVAIGTLGFRLICLRGVAVPQALDRRLAVAAGLGVTVALQAGIAGFSLRAEDALQLPFGRFLYGDLSPMAATRFGRAFVVMTLGYAVVLALIYLAWLLDRTVFLAPALGLSLLLVSGFSLSGHDAVDAGSSWLSELADWVHIAAASLWVGGLVALVALTWFGAPELRRIAFRRFSQLATVSIGLVLAAGIYLSVVRLPYLRDLWSTGYGQVLLVKIGLVLGALAWGGVHKFVVARAVERGAGPALLARVGRSLAGESLLGAAVLLVAAVLVDSRPPVALAATAAATRVDVGQWSYGLTAAGGSVWVGGLGIGDVVRIDPRSGRVAGQVSAGPRVFNLAAGGGAVWAVSNAASTLTRIDVRTGKASTPRPVGQRPYDVEWGFGSVWVSNAGDGTVWRITGGKVEKLTVGIEPNGLTAYHGSLWVSDHTAGKLLRIDPRTDRVTGSVALPGADWITGFGGSVYVSQETDVVTRVDVRTLKVLGRAKVARNPLGSAIVGGELWVPCIDANEVDVVDPATMRVLHRKPGGPGPIVVLPAFGHVWVSHTTGSRVWRL